MSIFKYNGEGAECIHTSKCPVEFPTSVVFIKETELVIVDSASEKVVVYKTADSSVEEVRLTGTIDGHVHSVRYHDNAVYVQTLDGSIYTASTDALEKATKSEQLSMSQWSPEYSIAAFGGKVHSYSVVSHKFYEDKTVLGESVNSFLLTKDYIFYTTLTHGLYAINSDKSVVYRRSVERGSRLVGYVPEDTKMVFQMPRGNLEVIHPREVVLDSVMRLLKEQNYQELFDVVRRHKVNYNFIRDYAFEQVVHDIPMIIDQIGTADKLNAFLLSLEDVELGEPYKFYIKPESANRVKQTKAIALGIRETLASKGYPKEFVTTFIATYLLLQPIDFTEVLRDLFHFNEEGRESGIVYMGTFFPTNALFKSALKTGSRKIARFVLNHSSLDPREYEGEVNGLSEE